MFYGLSNQYDFSKLLLRCNMNYTGLLLLEKDYGHPDGLSIWGFSDWGFYLEDPADPTSGKRPSMDDQYSIFGPILDRKAANQGRDFRTALSYPKSLPREFYPTIISYTGEFIKVPARQVFNFPDIRTNNQPRYSEAKSTDDIVVSDYQKGSLIVNYKPRYVTRNTGWDRTIYQPLHKLLGVPEPSSINPVKYRGRTWLRFPTVSSDRVQFSAHEEPCGNTIDGEALMSEILGGLKTDPDVVTTAVAEINGGTVDLATSLAEMPLFAKSALNGSMTILKLFKDAKSRDLRLKDRVKKVKAKWDREISKIDAKDRAGIQTARNQQIKDVNNILHEISSVWLNYRLNILPTALTIESSIDGLVFDRAAARFIRVRRSGDQAVGTSLGRFSALHRATIKRGLIPTAEWQGFFTVNLKRTAWELVPLSFVVDRYVNVGDWITANLSSPADYTSVEGATLSWMIKDAITTPCAVIDVNLYKRSVFSPDNYCQLTFPSSRSSDQSLDHLALAWSILTKKV